MREEREGGGMRERDEFELNLELSIGYGKTENCKGGIGKFLEKKNVAENDVCDPQRRREIQALRRQEARRKREEKIKKSRGQNGLFLEDKLFLEAQKLQARVEERESRERDCDLEERGRKKGSNGVGGELSLSLFTDNNKTERGECLYPKVQQPVNGFQYSCGVFPSWPDCDSEHSNGVNTTSKRSLEQCSSAVSDYQSISQKGGSSSDTGSHSSLIRPGQQHPGAPRSLESHESSETDQAVAAKVCALSNPQFNWRTRQESCFDQSYSTTSRENSNVAVSLPKMPCVSAKGNGPNGRTITGFLYKYTKTEVSIVCVCHGCLFSPAGFVEHAGGIDVSQPLKHITIVPR